MGKFGKNLGKMIGRPNPKTLLFTLLIGSPT